MTPEERLQRLDTFREHRATVKEDTVALHRAGVSQTELARRSGLVRHTIARWVTEAERNTTP